MPMNWNAQADAKLLGAIIQTSTTTMNWKAIAEIMGPHCTPIAVMRRVSRIKEKAKGCGSTVAKEGGENNDGYDNGPDSRASAQRTPVKRMRELVKKNAAAVTAAGADNESAGFNSVDPEESPTKKARDESKGKERMAVARTNEYADSDGGENEGIMMDALLNMEKEASDTDFD